MCTNCKACPAPIGRAAGTVYRAAVHAGLLDRLGRQHLLSFRLLRLRAIEHPGRIVALRPQLERAFGRVAGSDGDGVVIVGAVRSAGRRVAAQFWIDASVGYSFSIKGPVKGAGANRRINLDPFPGRNA